MQRQLSSMSGNSADFPKASYAAVGTVNAAIIALAKAFADRGIQDGVQVNSVLGWVLRMDGGEVKSI
jgi:NAD(P)-dependent dehydrogenase (short-subunit alcohol dehydrogenase family)